MEAKIYSVTFPDWKPANFTYWAADDWFAMKTRWEGHTTGFEHHPTTFAFAECDVAVTLDKHDAAV